jgi:GTPase
MASIFTYDPEPPRVDSPWLTPIDTPKSSTPQPRSGQTALFSAPTNSRYLSDYGVTRLKAEPQEGPTEYKLHLLLRPRRSYSSSSTISLAPSPSPNRDTGSILAPSNQSRQARLEQLTTQLLWRLQQSAPYHSSSSGDLVLPKLPEASSSLQTPSRPAKLLAGLEESRGALYEIGVSDDGTFVGLTKDEMDESLTNLKAMAASLGCNVEVVRMVVVGDCEWQESTSTSDRAEPRVPIHEKRLHSSEEPRLLRHQEQLWVAEALVTPDISSRKKHPSSVSNFDSNPGYTPNSLLIHTIDQPLAKEHETTEQLRITLTGPTTSGKSSLLGTLSTATLDNGRGKSRLSLLKHRHEIVSGMTSSVAQELIGYRGETVFNFASGNVSSWTDIHASTEAGRLVFVSDSAGHPRFRRTTVRGLVGWAPHWTVLCIAADDGENTPTGAGGTSSAQEILGTVGAGIDLSKAHLELCLKLDKPLAIVITKLDLASKNSLRQTLAKVLTAIKSTGRIPAIIPPDQSKSVAESDLTRTCGIESKMIQKTMALMKSSETLNSIVPIIMTSAAKGTGIRAMHKLLQELPLPSTPTSHDYIGPVLNPEQPSCIFHVEDIFGLPASYEPLASIGSKITDMGIVIAGHLRFGRLVVGDSVVVGPFPAESEEEDSSTVNPGPRSSPGSFGASLTHPSATELVRAASRNLVSASVTKGEWHNARIVSVRNLRLPVHTLEAGQVGTLGIVFENWQDECSENLLVSPSNKALRVRKGMVIAIPSKTMINTGHTLQAASGFTASFEDGDINSVTPGSLVVVYIASIRATARVTKVAPHEESYSVSLLTDEMDDVFGLEDPLEKEDGLEPPIFGSDGITDLTFELITTREWIELGSQILVMPGGGHGLYYGSERGEKGIAGLEGFVGRVTEVVD